MSNEYLSLVQSETVCGYEIKKMPIGAYLNAMELVSKFPGKLMESCFPGQDLKSVLENLKTLNEDGLKIIISGLLVSAPELFLELTSKLTGIDRKELVENEQIGIDGLIDITKAFIRVNRLGECIKEGAAALQTIRTTMTRTTGSKS